MLMSCIEINEDLISGILITMVVVLIMVLVIVFRSNRLPIICG